METLSQLSDVLALGKRLIAELDADEGRDTLSHWMAHHIAGLMHSLDEEQGQARNEREEACRRAILEVWAHRSSFRRGARPFAKLDRVIDTLEALDPDARSSFYFQSLADRSTKTDELDEAAVHWLSLARSLDRGARTLIGYCVARATEGSTDEASGWVELARKVESTLDTDIRLVRIVIQNASMLKEVVPSDERSVAKELLQRRVESLDELSRASAELRVQLADRIRQLDAGEDAEVVSP